MHTLLKHRAPLTVLLIASLVFIGLFGFTYALNSQESSHKDQLHSSDESTILKSLNGTETSSVSEQESNQAPEVRATEVKEGEKAVTDSVAPGHSSTSNSQTTIHISNTSNQDSTSVSLQISEDGCKVDAAGPSGTQLMIDTKNGSKGGHQEHILDGSPLSVSSGGMLAGMTVEAKLVDPSGSIKASSSSTIGSAGC